MSQPDLNLVTLGETCCMFTRRAEEFSLESDFEEMTAAYAIVDVHLQLKIATELTRIANTLENKALVDTVACSVLSGLEAEVHTWHERLDALEQKLDRLIVDHTTHSHPVDEDVSALNTRKYRAL